MDIIHQLIPSLKKLRLSGIAETLEVRQRQAISEKVPYLDFLSQLITDELERRQMRLLDRRLKKAGFEPQMTLSTYNFDFNPTINRQQILDMATTRFIEKKENVFLIGQAGVGKTHLAAALAHQACQKGFDVLFVKTPQVIRELMASKADMSWSTKMERFITPDLLVLDDWGLKPFGRQAADDLYEIIAERYEKGSIIITSNRSVKEWPELFGDPLLASAALDRLVHHAHIITITGKSYRASKTEIEKLKNYLKGGKKT